MKFRKWFFLVLALVTLLWAVATVSMSNHAVTAKSVGQSSAFQMGALLGGGMTTFLVLCISLPLATIFLIISWRNAVGIRNEKQHNELISRFTKGDTT